MGFKKENYTLKGIAMPLFISIFMCLFVQENIANSDNPPGNCNIGVIEEPRPTSRVKGTRHAQSTQLTYRNAEWSGLSNGRISDGVFVSTSLEGGISSASLDLNNFNFKIPTGSDIAGIEIYIHGKAEGDSTIDIRTKNLYLLDASGSKAGDNLKNFISIGHEWGNNPDTHVWKYGSSSYNWGGRLSPELLNSPDFGLSLEVKNHAETVTEVSIDKIEIVVHYTPAFTLCKDELHKCIGFFGPRTDDIVSYNWTLPPTFKELDDSEPEVFNLFLTDDTEPGLYEICLDIEYASGTDQCCRTIEVLDCTPSSVGDRVWEDMNGDGIQDDGEPGIDGIQLELYNDIDQLVGNTTSGTDGSYSFDNIDSGCYYVKASGLNGYLPSIGSNNFLDGSNGYGTTDYFTLDPDTSLSHIDLGLVQPSKICGTIWHDTDANGTFDQEPTLEGVTIELQGPDHTRSTITDGSGNYCFDDLVPGDYTLASTLLDRFEFTTIGVGGEETNSDLDDNGMVEVAGITSGTEINDIDGGMFKRGAIGNFVWYDFNVNGVQDDGESGIEGVKVRLMSADGMVSQSTTDASGVYSLRGVKPGDYYLAYTIGDDYIISIPNNGDDDTDSDVESLQDAMRTSDFTFLSCDTLSNVDAGFIFKPGTITGTVWSDDNRDGLRQSDESRQISTTVTLYNSSDQEIENKTVNAGEEYFFDQLQPGDFYVKFDALEDHIFSNSNAGDDQQDSDVTDADNGTTDLISITPDLTVANVDGGFAYLVSSISGAVWEDEDRNHKKGADEHNFSDIAVNLYFGSGDLVESTMTDGSGNYTFEELRRNDYYITFGEIEDYLFVTPNEGSNSENSNVTQSVTSGSTDMISLLADTDLTDINAGYILEVGKIVGEAFEDLDLDGANNDNESFENIEIKLFDESDNEVGNTTTDQDGTYEFDLVPVGDYYVHFELPNRFIYADSNATDDESQDSDVDGTNGEGTTQDVTIDNQDDEEELDGGYVINEGRVEGMVWKDNDEDGQRQSDEGGMEGVNISLHNTNGDEVGNTTTTDEGMYAFEEITAGDYFLMVDIPDDNIFTVPNQGDDTTDSDISEDNGQGTSDMFEVLTGRRTTNSDAGSVDNFGNILGLAWCDVNEDGILEANEELIAGIKVDLYTEGGSLVESTTTGQEGAYAFLEVQSGTYYLVFEDEADKNFTTPRAGNDDLFNSAVNSSLTNGSTFVFRVGTGNKDYIRNAGYQYLPGSISGQAWKDDNSNNINDDNSPFQGIAVTLFDENNNEQGSTTTDGNGNYNFQDLRRGNYYVVFSADENYLMLTAAESDDSDVTNGTTNGGTNILEVIANRETTDVDGGYLLALGSVTGTAWIDENDNALNDDNSPFQNVGVSLFNASGEVSSATTDNDGNYTFNDIYFGEYYVVFSDQTNYIFATANAGDDAIDSDVTGDNGSGSTSTFQVRPNSSTENVDGGYYLALGSLSGTAWIDENDNDTNDEDNGFESIEVTLYNTSGDRQSTTTNSDGAYSFNDILIGTYYVSFESKGDYDFVNPNTGDEDKDSDITGTNGDGSTDEVTIEARNETTNIDGGYVLAKGSITGSAWMDNNSNDINDDNLAFEGIAVTLTSAGEEQANTTTNADGNYSFENITPGTYTISFESKDDYEFVSPNVGDDNQDSDVINSSGDTDEITVGPREDVQDVDAGYLMLRGGIAGSVWQDENGDGVNNDEPALENISVTLYTEDGSEVASTDSNENGNYLFDDLIEGSYYVVFGNSDNNKFTTANAGEDNQDSDVTGANGDGSTDLIQVNPGSITEDVDAGYEMTSGNICGFIWNDDNSRDGINTEGDAFGDSVTVFLENADGETLQEAVTDPDGGYCFNNLSLGEYRIRFDLGEGQEFVEAKVGSDNGVDSDVTDREGGRTDLINLMDGDNSFYDAGIQTIIVKKGSISGKVWKDNNQDNIYNDGDDLVEGLVINLISEDGSVLGTLPSGSDGTYVFDDLDDGQYVVTFEDREGQMFVERRVGDDLSIDSDVIPNGDSIGVFGITDLVVIDGGNDVRDIDAGVYMDMMVELGSISGTAWLDQNDNSIDDDNAPLNGIEVRLFNSANEELANTTTNDNGNYNFTDVSDGTYYVVFGDRENYEFVTANEGSDDGVDSDVTGSNGNGSTDPFEVVSGQDVEDIDAGYFTDQELYSIRGKAFVDANSNNIDNDEAGLAGVQVFLLDTLDNELGVTTTDAEGLYAFTNLEAESYAVVFALPAERDFVVANEGSDDAIDSDVVFIQDGLGATNIIELTGNVVDVDAGYTDIETTEKGAICGSVWNDLNKNNINDDEAPLSEVEIILHDNLGAEVSTTFTDNNGNYTFSDLDEGIYYVFFDPITNYNYVSPREGDDRSIDSDVNGENGDGTTPKVEILGDTKIENLDAGYYTDEELYSLRGEAFIDINGNNIDDDMRGLADVQVFLLDTLDNELGVTVTDEGGSYIFNSLAPGSYVVVFVQPEGREFVTANEGDESMDSDVEFIQDGLGGTNIIVLNGNVSDIDAGFTPSDDDNKFSLSGNTWIDANRNGINDDEGPFEGIQVILVDSLDVETATTVTDAEGNYSFGDLEEGTYAVIFMLPGEYQFSNPNEGDDDTIDSDVEFVENDLGVTNIINLNGNVEDVDAGFMPDEVMESGSIAGHTFRDVNENGLNDDSTPFAGVEVNLLSETGDTIATTTTDINGNYTFENVDNGTYLIQFESRESEEFTRDNVGDDDTIDSDVIDSTGQTVQIVIADNADITNIDAGYTSDLEYYSISGSTWIDIDEDNLNNDDAPFSGIQVFLLDSLDAEAATTMTDSLGNYTFANVTEGTYGVVFTLPPNYKFSEANIGDDDAIDSDVILTQNNLGAADKIVLEGDVADIDAGYIGVEPSGLSIAGSTFIDTDENGLDDDDNPYGNVTVILSDTTGMEITRTSTDELGAYTFNELDTGAYFVTFWLDSTYVFTAANVGDDDTIDSDVTDTSEDSGSTAVIDLIESITDIDAGYISTDSTMMMMVGSLAGIVWEDSSIDGIRQSDESGIQGVEVKLLNSTGEEVGSTTTDGDGNYSFADVPTGDYTVRFVNADNQTFVLADQGEDDSVDSDVIDIEGNTATFTITADSTLSGVDAGLLIELPQASLCGNVWIDANEDGINDDGEDGVIGILINIFRENGEFIDSTRTTTNGFYSFTDLLGGYYYLEFDTEGDYLFTVADATADDLDSDVTEENGEGTTAVFLGTGKIDIDAGLIPETGSYISGKVWGDTNEDNTFGPDDIVFAGHEVFLVNRLARVIATTVTDANGNYRFDLDVTGEYAVFFANDNEEIFVEADASGDDKTDSDVVDVITINETFGTTNLISFASGQRIKNVDAGIVSTIERAEALSGVVWMDENEDGIRQEDESLLAGVEIQLFNSDDELIATVTTDANGAYNIADLDSGDYYLQFVMSDGEFVAANQGDDDSVDSDVEDLETGNTATFTFVQGELQRFDAGVMGDITIANTICGTVWNDVDQNNVNNGEQGRAGHTVYLMRDTIAFDTTITDADGSYSFADLEPGSYRVIVEQVDGYQFAEENAGDNESIDSDVNGSGMSDLISVEGKVTIDAGVYFSVVGISGKVWGDRDENDEYGDGDILIGGHMVFLVNRTARVLQTTTTADDGTYRFEGLATGSYAVFFDVVGDDMFVSPNSSGDEATDSDVIEVITQIGPYAVTNFVEYEENSTVSNIDAGLVRTATNAGTVAGVIWIDSSADGIRQDDEDLFSGITVTLYNANDEEISTTTSDEAGAYEFSDVTPGEYYVIFTVNGRDFVEAKQGGDDRVDSDVEDLDTGRSANFEVEVEMTTRVDAGIQAGQTGVCGVVWFDFNENGQLDGDEGGMEDYEIKLYNSAGEEVASTNTNEAGAYTFTEVEDGDYYIEVDLGGAYDFTEAKVGDDATDSDITEANGTGTTDVFTYNGSRIKLDAGKISIIPIFVSGTVWQDLDGDNIFNNDDDMVDGLTVYLQSGGVFIDTTTTNPDGTYQFDDLPVGTYVVHFEQRDGLFFVIPNIGQDDDNDSEVVGTVEIDGVTYGVSEELVLGSGEVGNKIDAGITEMQSDPGSIAGEVWLDDNDDGINNEGEGTIEGVTVTLIDNGGNIIGMTDIPADGTYKFDNLIPGVYGVIFNIPDEFTFVEAGIGEETEDSDVFMSDGGIGTTEPITVADGENIENVDAGVKPVVVNFSTIGDFVWLDVDEDGVFDNDELGMNEVNVELIDAVTDNVISSMLTTNHPELKEPGYYSFSELPSGDYYVRFTLPNGYIFSNPRMGTELTKDSDVTGANGTGTTNTLSVDQITMTDIDVGAITTNKAVIGDFVFNDRNANGIQDANEDGINNIRVRVFDTDNQQVAQTFTQYNRAMDRAGYFSFKVDPGTYYLRFDISQGLSFTESDQGGNDERDSDVNGENGFGTTSVFEVNLAETKLSLDAGLITEPANLGDKLWVDANSNGVQDADEDGVNGVEVSLYDSESNFLSSKTTESFNGEAGYYLFENISAGSYYISFDIPDGYTATVPNIGGNDASDSDITDVFGKGTTSLFTLSSGEDELDIDGGIVLSSSIGDYVWEDTNADGIQDNNEPGAEGISVSLLDASGSLLSTTTTDANGKYLFGDLVAGDYTVEFEIPSDRAVTSNNNGGDDDLDSDIENDGKSPTIRLASDENIENIDLGLVINTVAFNANIENELIANVYPNPTIRFLTISTNEIYQDDTDLKEVKIFNNQGAVVKSYDDLKSFKNNGPKEYELDLNGVSPGVYYIRAKVGRLTYQTKLILMNN